MTRCGACHSHNRIDRKFCSNCGLPLARNCPACRAVNLGDERFCGECGAALRLPPDRTMAASSSAGRERKHITVLFADVAGSMDLQEQLDAEVWAQIMGRFASILAEGVRRYGGTVDKFTGDGIMALFGAPLAQEDHARRACHAAWRLMTLLGDYSAELRIQQRVELHVRLGLNSGEVVIGRIGDDVALDGTALGYTVGLAQRMECIAEPDTAYLTEHTRRLVDGWFRTEDLGTVRLKGASDPIRVFELGPPVPASTRHAVAAASLVGRARELAALEAALDMALAGRAQVVGVVGEAGVGKSRLCDEFAGEVTRRGITVRRASGVSHGQEVPLLPILAFQREYFGITDADDPPSAREKISKRLLALDPTLDEALPLIFDFLEVPDPERPVGRMAPEVRMRRIVETVRQITARRSDREALVLIFEDLHWFDAQSATFLQRLIESYPGSRTLVVTNFRPEFTAAWMRHRYFRQLPLAPLPEDAASELLKALLGDDRSLALVISTVLERTGGNPFFIEEVIRSLVEDGTLAGDRGAYRLVKPLDDIHVPPSVRSVLASRIDQLPIEDKAVLQTAAVIGRTWTVPLLARVSAAGRRPLRQSLRQLCAAELLQEAGNETYRFWHPLTQEVAYQTLLAARRAELHAAVAAALESSEAGNIDEIAPVLAWHWQQAGRPLEAARWSVRAGEWALRTDLDAAEMRWRAAISLLDGATETTEGLAIGVRARMRLVQFGARRGIEAGEADRLYAQGIELAERLGDQRLVIMTTLLHGSVALFAGEHRPARARYQEAIRLADATSDRELKATVRAGLCVGLGYIGPLQDWLTLLDEVIEACAGDPDVGTGLIGYGLLAVALARRSECLGFMGRLDEAADLADEALVIARRRRDPEVLTWALTAHAWLATLRGDAHDVRPLAEEALGIAEETGNVTTVARALVALALAESMVGEAGRAAAASDRALAEARRNRSARLEHASAAACLARSHVAMGNVSAAIASADEAVDTAQRQGARVIEPFALLARVQARRLDEARADACLADLADAQRLMEAVGARVYEPFILEEQFRVRQDEEDARRAVRLYEELGADGHARRLRTEFGSVIRGDRR